MIKTVNLIILANLLFCGCLQQVFAMKQGILIIPGIGRADRLRTSLSNLLMLDRYLFGDASNWDCVAYIYALHNDTKFWALQSELAILRKYCSVIENPGKRVTENLYMAQPALMKESYEYVFILLDDCKLLGSDGFPLSYMIEVMKENKLTVASPLVRSIDMQCLLR